MYTPPFHYHRIARAVRLSKYAWWKPLLELFITCLLGFIFMLVWMILIELVLVPSGYPLRGAGSILELDESDPASKLMLYGGLAAMLPAPFIAARIMGRPAGSLLSVYSRFRWKMFFAALACTVVYWAGMTLIDAAVAGSFTGPNPAELDARLIISTMVIFTILPLQCAAEEVIFRGTFAQTFGAWMKSPWLAYLPGIPAFVIMHEYDASGLLIIAIFAVMVTILTHRTGGLEVAIAFHISNNISVEYGEIMDLNSVDVFTRPTLLLSSEFSIWILFLLLMVVFNRARHRPETQMHPPMPLYPQPVAPGQW